MDKQGTYEAEYKKGALKLAKKIGAKKASEDFKYHTELCMTGSKKLSAQ